MTTHVRRMSPMWRALDRPEPVLASTDPGPWQAAFYSRFSVLSRRGLCHTECQIQGTPNARTAPGKYYWSVRNWHSKRAVALDNENASSAISTRNSPRAGAQFSIGFTCRLRGRSGRVPASRPSQCA